MHPPIAQEPFPGPAEVHPRPELEIRPGLLARNTLLNMIGLGLPMVVGVLAMPFTIRWLGAERFGILSLVWVVVGYLAFFDLGLSRATTKFIAEALGRGDSDEISGVLWTTVFFQGMLGLVGAALLALATPLLVERFLHIPAQLMPEARVSFILIGISLPVVLASASFRGALEARQRFDLVNIVKGGSSTLNYILPLAGVGLGFDLRGIVALLVGARVLALVAWIWLCLKAFPGLIRNVALRRENVPGLLRFGSWLTVSNIVGPILTYLDRFLIGSILNMRAVGFYVAPYEIVTKVGILPGSLILTLFPSFSTLQGREERDRAKTLFGCAVKYLIIGIGPVSVLLVLLARPILEVWLGAEFARTSTLTFQILALGFLTNSLAGVPLALIQGIGRPDLPAKLNLAEFFLFIPMSWLFIRAWGIAGAAAAWTLRVTFELAVLLAMASRTANMRFSRRELVKSGLPQGVLALALFGLGGGLVQHLYGKPFGLLVPLAAFLGVCGFFVVSKQEIAWIRAGLPRFLAGSGERGAGA
jgi:O-antigen/teichoic acid export membrane protein